MKVLVEIPEHKLQSLQDYLTSIGGSSLLPASVSAQNAEIFAELVESLHEVRQFEKGATTLKSVNQFLDEL